jgi:hypothetical protein
MKTWLTSLPIGAVVDQWCDLRPAKSVKTGGQIHLLLHFGLRDAPALVQTPFPRLANRLLF